MFDYNKEYDITEHTKHFPESMERVKEGKASLQDLRNMNSAFYFAAYNMEAQQLNEKTGPLTLDEYEYAYNMYMNMSAPKSVTGSDDPMFKVLLKQPLESLDYLFNIDSTFSHHRHHLIYTVLKSYGYDLSDELMDTYRKRFYMFDKYEQSALALKSLWGDIKKRNA